MGIDLTKLQPHKVSRSLSGYIIYIYSKPKGGKTSFIARAEKSLILAFEKGYNALDGVMAQDINSWADIKAVMRDLKKPEVRAMFDVIGIDTIDIAAKYCEKYVCMQAGVDDLGDIPYGRGYKAMREEFDDVFTTMTKLGYSVIFVSHESTVTLTREDGSTYNRIQPSLSPDKVNAIIENMADIYGYARLVVTNDDAPNRVMLTLRDNTGMVACGSRFKYIKPEIPFTYEDLTQAVSDAIDEQLAHGDERNFTDETLATQSDVSDEQPKYDFDALKAEFDSIVGGIRAEHKAEFTKEYGPRIANIVASTLGKGNKVNDMRPEQAELLYVIVSALKDEFQLS